MSDLPTKIKRIGSVGAFPSNNCNKGMTYRQWLIGQALASTSDIDIKYAHLNAKAAIAHADEVIRLLAEEVTDE